MSVFDGLSKFGLNNITGSGLYETEKKETTVKKEEVKVEKEIKEEDFLFDKTYTCPICDEHFKVPTLRANRARLVGQDMDLRPRYENIDPLKYDIVLCPKCGYAALPRFFDTITPPQKKLIKDNICKNFVPIASKSVYTYDDAFMRYQLALGNAVVKKGKAGEKAYLCLKMAWLLRGKMENLDPASADYDEQIASIKGDEKELLSSALEGLVTARQTEMFPMCGMDEHTVDYIIAVTAIKFEEYELASRMISSIIVSPSANSRMKDRCRDLKEQLLELRKE